MSLSEYCEIPSSIVIAALCKTRTEFLAVSRVREKIDRTTRAASDANA